MSRKDRFDDGLKSISVGNPVADLGDAIVGTYCDSGCGSGVDVCNNNNNNNGGGGTGFLIDESEMVL